MVERKPQVGRWIAASAIGAVLLAGCTGRDVPDDDASTTPETPSSSPPPPSSTMTAQAIEFEYQPPEEPCPPVAALRLPSAERHPYALTDPFLNEGRFNIMSVCDYELANLSRQEQDMVLDDHVSITLQATLYPSRSDSRYRDLDDLPLASSDLDSWGRAASVFSDERGVVWEGCGPAMPCADGEEPTVKTHATFTDINGLAGNLQFTVWITYTAEQPPADVERRSLAIFRDLVLADVARRERVE